MSAKASFPLALVLTIFGMGIVRGDELLLSQDVTGSPPVFPGGTDVSVSPGTQANSPTSIPSVGGSLMPNGPGSPHPGEGTIAHASGLSSWILYTHGDCCGPVGSHGPIMSEFYVRNGPSIPVGGGVLGVAVQTGWMFQGGGRSLFFDPELTHAWVVDIGISYNYNAGIGGKFISFIPPGGDTPIDLQLRQFSRTSFNLAFGRETYLYVWGNGAALRAGAHAGGQLGTIKADWEVIEHTTDMLWAVTLAGNLDVEIPWGCCTLVGGFRVEWNYIFESDIVQHQNDNDLQSVNLLIATGIRF